MSDRKYTPKDFYVYVHRKATTGEPFYVGKGRGPRAWFQANRGAWWKRIVRKHGFTVDIIMDGLQEWAAFELERDTIALHGRRQNAAGPLINATDGGEGASGVSEETRLKLAEHAKRTLRLAIYDEKRLMAMAATRRTAEAREAQGRRTRAMWSTQRDKMLGAVERRTRDPEWRRKNAEAVRATCATESWREANRAATKKLWADAGFRAKNAAAVTQMTQTAAWRTKNKETLVRTMQQPEWKRAHAEGVKRRTASAEWRQKNRDSVRRACGKAVRCVDTDTVFSTQSDAVAWLVALGHTKATGASIIRAMKHNGTAYGLRWQRV